MNKLAVISIRNEDGTLTGWLKDKPMVIAEANDHVELLEKLIAADKFVSEVVED